MKSEIVFWDLETGDLAGDFGSVLCGCFLGLEDDEPITVSGFNPNKPADLWVDKEVARRCRDILNDAWIWVTWNGKMFDVPFLNARLRNAGLKPLEKRMHIDLMYYARGQFCRIHSSRLDAVAQVFDLDHQKIHLTPQDHVKARHGDPVAFQKLVDHCVADCKILRDAFYILKYFIQNVHK